MVDTNELWKLPGQVSVCSVMLQVRYMELLSKLHVPESVHLPPREVQLHENELKNTLQVLLDMLLSNVHIDVNFNARCISKVI